MAVSEIVQTFAGITNENEFFSHHYLSEVFRGDIAARLAQWKETDDPDGERSPQAQLRTGARAWKARLVELQALGRRRRSREQLGEALALHRELHRPLLEALGYSLQPAEAEAEPGCPVPVWAAHGQGDRPHLLIVPTFAPGNEASPLDQPLLPEHYPTIAAVPQKLKGKTFADAISDALFGAEKPPRFVLAVGEAEWLLLDRLKWPNNRTLRFDWESILDRRDGPTLDAVAALLHRETLAPDAGASLLDSLDENAHKHAFGVSEDLKYSVREAIELLGQEAATQLRQQAQEAKRGFYSGKDALDPADLSLECLRLVYRLLFLFYIEARPELGYVPIQSSETYQKGYSLEHLRDLADTAVHTPGAGEGRYFDRTLRLLFGLIARGCGPKAGDVALTQGTIEDVFALAPLDSRLFDPESTPMLNRVSFPDHIWQRVIYKMSVGGGKRKGRISYQLLSINQLGAVYEALLSYKGFFAATELYEVAPAPKKATKPDPDDEEGEGDEEPGDDESPKTGAGAETNVLDGGWFVPASRVIKEFAPEEIVTFVDEDGHRRNRVYPKDSFIFRPAGRDRAKSGSYYTPQSLTQCVVKYALKELLEGKSADDILSLTVIEPAMGSAAFLNEAVNQLSEAYLERKQAELARRIPHEDYARERQRVRMYLADRNVFGVDLNPTAVELAEVSLWLNAIYGEKPEPGGVPRPARVPWFGYQLFAGNSLVGARREVYKTSLLIKGAKPAWHESAPRRLDPQKPDRQPDEVYHFLLPDPGMADWKDKVAKDLYPDEFKRAAAWRKEACKPLDDLEIQTLLRLSDLIDELWDEHTRWLSHDREATEDALPVWPHTEAAAAPGSSSDRRQKDAILRAGMLSADADEATPFRRLTLLMDLWCALWFWPIGKAESLPDRNYWWMLAGAILDGSLIDTTPAPALDLFGVDPSPAETPLVPELQPSILGMDEQLALSVPAPPKLKDKFGNLKIAVVRDLFPLLSEVEALGQRYRFFHWELTFSDVFASRGGFDLVLGNPPWLRVQWEEGGILGERNPLFAIRKFSGPELAKRRAEAFKEFSGLQEAWTEELSEVGGILAFLNAYQNYPILQKMQTNLYKCFLPIGWYISQNEGAIGFLHPEGPYEDPKGANLRQEIYRRLRGHYQFVNEMKLFADVHNNTTFSINIYGRSLEKISFSHIANLFSPNTIDSTLTSLPTSRVGGYKDDNGRWNVAGHPDRLISVNEEALGLFAKLYDEAGTPSNQARLPALHAK